MTGTGSCPSRFALQRFALCAEDPEGRVAVHLPLCSDCQRLVSEYEVAGHAYMNSPAAHSSRQRLGGLEAKARPGADRVAARSWAWGGALAAAAALGLVLSVASRGTPSDGVEGRVAGELQGNDVDALSPKGAAQLLLWVGDEGQAGEKLGDLPSLHPGERVQPVFAGPGRGFVALLLTTPAGEVIQLHPNGRSESAPWEARVSAPLGPSFRLDEEVGRYRLAAYFSESGFSTTPLLAGDEAAGFSGIVLLRHFEVRR